MIIVMQHMVAWTLTHMRILLCIVLGSIAIKAHYTNCECDLSPYADSHEPKRNVPIVIGAMAVTSSNTGMTYILIFNKEIWMGKLLDHLLINPNQIRFHGVHVQDNPWGM